MSENATKYNAWYACYWLNNLGEFGCYNDNATWDLGDYDTVKDALNAIADHSVKNPPRLFVDRYDDDAIRFLDFEAFEIDKLVWDEEEQEWEDMGDVELPDWAGDSRGGEIAKYGELLDMGSDAYDYAKEKDIPLDLEKQPYDNDTQRGHYVPYAWIQRDGR